MTLIIAGHSLHQMSFGGHKSTHVDGVFFASDSNITQGSDVVVSGFKKVYEMPVRVNGLNFLGNWFNGYHGFSYEGGCAIAFAGSTLVSQHIMNSIRNHLGELKPTYFDEKYQLVMVCEPHKFIGQYCDEDMFKPIDLGPNHLLTAPFIAGVVQHAIQSVLDRASKHKGMKKNFQAYRADFILGVCCPETRKYHIYRYEIVPGIRNEADAGSEESVPAVATMEEIPVGKVAVIGMRKLHEEDADAAFAAAVEAGKHTDHAMLDFLTTAIRRQNEIGVFDIGLPAFLYKQRGIRLELEKRQDEAMAQRDAGNLGPGLGALLDDLDFKGF